MKKVFSLIVVLVMAWSCTEPIVEEVQPDTPDLEYVNASFEYVSGINQYGVPADKWAGKSEITFFYVSDSESGNPQGRIMWKFKGEKPMMAWWRLDMANSAIAIFGERGTQGLLKVSDHHEIIKQSWRPVYINENGHLVIEETPSDDYRWEFRRVADATDWQGE
jgi:hypothetical protein